MQKKMTKHMQIPRYLSPVSASGVQHPDYVRDHYNCGNAHLRYGGCTSQQQMMQSEQCDCEGCSAGDVFSGAMMMVFLKYRARIFNECFSARKSFVLHSDISYEEIANYKSFDAYLALSKWEIQKENMR